MGENKEGGIEKEMCCDLSALLKASQPKYLRTLKINYYDIRMTQIPTMEIIQPAISFFLIMLSLYGAFYYKKNF